MSKLFHPTIGGSIQRIRQRPNVQNETNIYHAALILHQIGWLAQQGFPAEECTVRIQQMLQKNREGMVMACAAGLQLISQGGQLDNR